MKNFNKVLKAFACVAVFAAASFWACSNPVEYEFGLFETGFPPGGHIFTDFRDGKTYRTVVIGSQTWMAENLNFETSSGSWCYNNQTSNCDIYGRLYDWATAMNIDASYSSTLYGTESCGSGSSCWNPASLPHRGVCPSGWHLPTNEEWDELMIAVGGVFEDMGGWDYWHGAGTKLKSSTGWTDQGLYAPVGTDDYGFSALPGGYRLFGSFYDVGYRGRWWSATDGSAFGGFGGDARGWVMFYDDEDVGSDWSSKINGFSVRCVRDN